MTTTKTHPFAALVHDSRHKHRKPGNPAVPITEVAKDCKVSRQYLYSLMREANAPGLAVLERLAAGLDVSVAALQQAFARAKSNGWPSRTRAKVKRKARRKAS